MSHYEGYSIVIFDFEGNLKNKIENLPAMTSFYHMDDTTLIASSYLMKDIFIIDIHNKTVEKMEKRGDRVFSAPSSKIVEIHQCNYLEFLALKKS